jgi:hypothetical protein
MYKITTVMGLIVESKGDTIQTSQGFMFFFSYTPKWYNLKAKEVFTVLPIKDIEIVMKMEDK